jgi:glycerol-3-phosphate O-acyltransferase
VTQAVFPEGGLTRDGSLQPAKLGLLSYMVAKFSINDERDIVFIPVGINYDRVIEDRNLTSHLAKIEGISLKTKGSLAVFIYLFGAFKRRITGKWYRLGYASVSFGEPLSLKEYCFDKRMDLKLLPEEQKFKAIEGLGVKLMGEISKIIPVLPVSMVARLLLKSKEPINNFELRAQMAAMLDFLRDKGIHIHIPRQELDYAIETGLRMLTLRHLIIEKDDTYEMNSKEKHILAFYANAIKHYFNDDAVT